MCGIAGVIDFAGRPIDRDGLEGSCDLLAHRGPDDRGVWVHESPGFSVGLAHTRLAVIDPAPEAHQPMTTDDGRRAIGYNGELYNYRAIREQLPQPLRTASDTEVFLEACRQWGPAALQRFDGMWAAAVIDTTSRSGHLSRDPLGIKPLYHAECDRRLCFASELKTLVQLLPEPPEIDPEAVACYLHLGFIPHPLTIYRRIFKLSPGHVLTFDANGPAEPQRYFYLDPPPTTSPPTTPTTTPSYADACGTLRKMIEDAVVRQCVCDVPLGALLSGGLDSSVVTACMARQAGQPIPTFSIGYADHPRYDETDYAQLVARHLGTRHHAIRLTFADVLAAVEPMLSHPGEPLADSSLLPTSLVSRHTRQHVTVAMSGDGGDELFGGYRRYLGHHHLAQYHRVPTWLRRGAIEPLLRLVPEARSTRRLDRLRQLRKLPRGDHPDAMRRHLAWARFMEPDLAANLIGRDRAETADRDIARMYDTAADGWRERPADEPPLQRVLLADLAVGLPADMLSKVDTASMYHSLEVRVPLLSTDVVNFAANLPLHYKIDGARTKRILRDAFCDVLPDAVVRRGKMGFEVPVGEFLRRELRERYTSTVTADALGGFGIDADAARRVYDEHCARRRDRTELLWSLLVLCGWKHHGPGTSAEPG